MVLWLALASQGGTNAVGVGTINIVVAKNKVWMGRWECYATTTFYGLVYNQLLSSGASLVVNEVAEVAPTGALVIACHVESGGGSSTTVTTNKCNYPTKEPLCSLEVFLGNSFRKGRPLLRWKVVDRWMKDNNRGEAGVIKSLTLLWFGRRLNFTKQNQSESDGTVRHHFF